MSPASPIARFIIEGFQHIVPGGPDHILFVLGLFFLCRSPAPLLWLITLFTAAHSLTLGLAMTGIVELPARPVEVLIALSIAFVGVENLRRRSPGAWGSFIVFFFGLIHGLGFASAFRQAAVPDGQFAASLLAFNLGIELGQLAVIAAAFLLAGWWREKPWYTTRIALPASALIALAGLAWAVQRALGAG